ncbi:OmpA family protein [uncultured Nevskia sp.]|uniref:OmpA family protein n=1 Tax=uncultured Nevskia sp. TaxID=228950 RepID=UPI0025EAF0C7|nr:OmpA family protein [uncultured Nevskia sp.]
MSAHHICINRLVAQAVLAGTTLAMAACATTAVRDPGADRVRAELTALQSDSRLATQAPVAMQAAEKAVTEAEMLSIDSGLNTHRVYIASRRVQTARALAEAEYAVAQRKLLSDQSDQVRLDARTREADVAKSATVIARADANAAQSRNDTLVAELADLKAKKTDRGVQLTLGDVLFSSGRAELAAGSAVNLDKLVAALATTPDRQLIIEGFTDSQGSDAMNMTLSQNRADAVSTYLSGRGIARDRITATGRGEAYPVAGNEIAAGRQLNRRVEVTIQNPPQ